MSSPKSGRSTRVLTLILPLLLSSSSVSSSVSNTGGRQQDDSWTMSTFEKQDDENPILGPINETLFLCPVKKEEVAWESKDLFNPTALVKDGKIHLLYRAEDYDDDVMGTSRIGLATSEDGINFVRETKPIFYPDNDNVNDYEWEGGCEDPRIVETASGEYVMTYTGYNGSLAILMVAKTPDLRKWTKYGPVFRTSEDYNYLWSKSGSIVTVLKDEKFIAEKINGKYWMYWGDSDLYLASSDDLLDWTPIMEEDGSLVKIAEPRAGKFDSDLVEPGPQAILRDDGIFLIYNSKNKEGDAGDATLPEGTYAAGQFLFNKTNPRQVLKRTDNYFMKPDKDYEIIGQINNVVFLEGLVCYKGKWFLYYGTADSKIAVAIGQDEHCKTVDGSGAGYLKSNTFLFPFLSIVLACLSSHYSSST